MIKITCTSCQKPLSIDETKLPMKEVSFPCPVCKAKLTIDRTKLGVQAAAAAPAPAPPQEEPEIERAAAPSDVSSDASSAADDDDHDFASSRALIIGVDRPDVRQAAKSIGLNPVFFPTAEAGRDFYYREYPPVAFLVPQQLTPPPMQELAAMTSVSPTDRRKGFYVLVADNLRTLDGNAAFLYQVNLVVATKDLPKFKAIYRDAEVFHKRLYAAVNSLAH